MKDGGVGGNPKDIDEDHPVRGFFFFFFTQWTCLLHVGPEQTAENAGKHLSVTSHKCSQGHNFLSDLTVGYITSQVYQSYRSRSEQRI